jgi:hypothetical protein
MPSGTATPNPLLGAQSGHQLPLQGSPLSPIQSRGGSGAHRSARDRAKKDAWWRIDWGRGMINDIKRRAPYYWSDWTDAWDYRVVPATVYMYFAK